MAPNAGEAGGAAELLQRRTQAMRARVRLLDEGIQQVRQDILTTKADIERLQKALDDLKSSQPPDEVEPVDEARKVPYRPPLFRIVRKNTPLAFICKQGRVYVADFHEMNEAFAEMIQDKAPLELKEGKPIRIRGGDCEQVIELTSPTTYAIYIDPIENSGVSLEDAIAESSSFRSRIEKIDPIKDVLQFRVYPDSFDMFREVRKLVYAHKVDINWSPVSHGERIGVGSGDGSVGVQ